MNSPEPGPAAVSPLPRSATSAASWPRPSPAAAFAARRERLRQCGPGALVLAAGSPRARNFPQNTYPFRAESHFLYFIGRQLEGALLLLDEEGFRLFVPLPDPAARLWHGPEPTPTELAAELGLPVLPLSELPPLYGAATLPPQDAATAAWLSERLGREVTAGSGARLSTLDGELADAVIALRSTHDPAAIEQLRQAAAVSVEAHRAGMRETEPGQREMTVSAAMQRAMFAAGMGLSYAPIVTVHGEVLHSHRSDREMRTGDLLLADVGAETPEGWAADITRTWPVSGRFSPTQRELYSAVLEARAAALAALGPGASYREVHLESQRALARCLVDLRILRGSPEELEACHAAALFYPHGVGHLLGLDVHDMEDLGDRAGYAPGRERTTDPTCRFLRLDRDLQPGMAVTIEPGFYLIPELLSSIEPGSARARVLDRERLAVFSDVRGIRIEDDVLVTANGYEVLTHALPVAPDAIEQLVGATRASRAGFPPL